jgi:hypothetical protein
VIFCLSSFHFFFWYSTGKKSIECIGLLFHSNQNQLVRADLEIAIRTLFYMAGQIQKILSKIYKEFIFAQRSFTVLFFCLQFYYLLNTVIPSQHIRKIAEKRGCFID